MKDVQVYLGMLSDLCSSACVHASHTFDGICCSSVLKKRFSNPLIHKNSRLRENDKESGICMHMREIFLLCRLQIVN